MEGHVLSEEASDEAKIETSQKKGDRQHKKERKYGRNYEDNSVSSAAALVGTTSANKTRCGFCSGDHEATKCKEALKKSHEKRRVMLKDNKLVLTCFNCLRPGSESHNCRTCKRPRCTVNDCRRKHHESGGEEEEIQAISCQRPANRVCYPLLVPN